MVKTGDWIKQGWELVKQDLGMHIVICLVLFLISGTGIGELLLPTLMCGWMWVFLQKMRDPNYKVAIGDVFSKGFEVFVPSLVAGLLIGLFSSLGAIACFVGSIVVYALLMFALPLIIDRRMEFWPAIQLSLETTQANWFPWSLFVLVLGLLQLAGAIPCGLGLLITLPIQVAAITIAYKETFGAADAAPAAPEAPAAPPV